MVDKPYHRANARSSLDRSRASLWSYRALFVNALHPQQARNYGLKALQCTHIAFLYITRIPEVDLGGAVQDERKDQARIEFRPQ